MLITRVPCAHIVNSVRYVCKKKRNPVVMKLQLKTKLNVTDSIVLYDHV